MKKNPSICVVVAVRNRLRYTKRFLKNFLKSSYKNYKIVMVDDASTDGTPEYILKKYPEVELIRGNGNLWWTGGTNKGVRYALKNNFDYVLTINDDAVVDTRYLETLVKCALKRPNSLMGSLIIRSDNKKIYSVGGCLNWTYAHLFNFNFPDEDVSVIKKIKNPYPVEIMNGDGTLIPTKVFKKVGLYSRLFTPQFHADSEITVRSARQGFKAYICLDAVLINQINKKPLTHNRRQILFSKKSDYYLPAILYFYFKYCPKGKFHGFFRQYYHFFRGGRRFTILENIYRRLFKRDFVK